MTVVQFPKREAGLSEEHAGLIGCLGRVIASVLAEYDDAQRPYGIELLKDAIADKLNGEEAC